ncbi:MAG: hypothetical protein QOF58_4379, partial [Pseudonocardiales bacterium]|nr:hypothetical protein [Pseudonocardiales bacterium]
MTLWTEFTSQPFTHPRIPHVAQAGYRLGAAPPHPPARFDVTDFGARGDGRHDSADAINRAVAEAGRSGGGCVQIPPGRYLLEDVLRISHGDVVLRGAGSAETTLVWRTPLEDLVGVSKSRYGGESSAWSWSGGLIWVCAAERLDRLTHDIRRGSWPREGWIDRGTAAQQHLAGVRLPARRGDFAVTVDRPDELKPGQRVVLLWHDCDQHSLLKHICGDVEAAATYPWQEKSKLLSYLPYAWPVRIERVSGSQVFLRQPL